VSLKISIFNVTLLALAIVFMQQNVKRVYFKYGVRIIKLLTVWYSEFYEM